MAGREDYDGYNQLRLQSLATDPDVYLDLILEEYERPQEEVEAILMINVGQLC